jgi:hypothetical protein
MSCYSPTVEGLLNQADLHATYVENYSGGGGPGGEDPRDHWKGEIKAFLQRAKNLVQKRLKGSTRDAYLKQINEIAGKVGVILD